MKEFDGSDSGARPDEAKSWGKIRYDASLSCAVVQEFCQPLHSDLGELLCEYEPESDCDEVKKYRHTA